MPRQKKARRFDPRYGVGQAALDVEAEYLRREVDDYAIMAPADVESRRAERHNNCERTWKHLCLILESVPEHDQQVIQALLFRDLWLVLELYRTYLQPRDAPATSVPPPDTVPEKPPEFSQFLFDL
jgi:hypothetical protein